MTRLRFGKTAFFMIGIVFICIVFIIVWRFPLLGSDITKQTIYVGIMQTWDGLSTDSQAHALWIDDDSSPGVFAVKEIADEVGIRPTFAVIADRMEKYLADSLASWQKQGAGIIVHGFQHKSWKNWNEEQINEDIFLSYERLYEQGFDTAKIIKIIVPPHGCNTRAIRTVINRRGCQMITGANLVNNNRYSFLLGRINISSDTDMDEMRYILQKAYKRKAYVIFATHSSIPDSFSKEKTKSVLRMAKEIGFSFDFSK